MKNKRFWLLALVLGIYLIVISFPVYLMTNDVHVRLIVMLSLRTAYLIFIIVFSIFLKLLKSYYGKTRLFNILLLSPLFLVAFMNLFYWLVVTKSNLPLNTDATLNVLKIFLIIVTVAEEEILFRMVVQKNIVLGHKIIRIVITAAIFAFAHIFTILFEGYPIVHPIELLQLIVLFAIGLILGILYEYTNNLVVPITFSLIYSFCTDFLAKNTFLEADYKYYITIAAFLLFASAYINAFYFLMLKKENR